MEYQVNLMVANGHLKHGKGKKTVVSEAQTACPHPQEHRITRGNAHASWDVCTRCKLRVAYRPKGGAVDQAAGSRVEEINAAAANRAAGPKATTPAKAKASAKSGVRRSLPEVESMEVDDYESLERQAAALAREAVRAEGPPTLAASAGTRPPPMTRPSNNMMNQALQEMRGMQQNMMQQQVQQTEILRTLAMAMMQQQPVATTMQPPPIPPHQVPGPQLNHQLPSEDSEDYQVAELM